MGFLCKIEIGGNISKKIFDDFEDLFRENFDNCIITKGSYEGETYNGGSSYNMITNYLEKNKINYKVLTNDNYDETVSSITYWKYVPPSKGNSKVIHAHATCDMSNPQVYFDANFEINDADILERFKALKSSVQFLIAYLKKGTRAIPLFTKDENIRDLIKSMLDNSKDPYDLLTEYTDNLFCKKIPEIDPLKIIK